MLEQARQLREYLLAGWTLERVYFCVVYKFKILVIEHIIAVVFVDVVSPPVTLCNSRIEVNLVDTSCARMGF